MEYPHGFSKEVVAKGQAVLEAKGKSVGEIKDDFIDFLEGYHATAETRKAER